MTRTFLVALDLQPTQDPSIFVDEITDSLLTDGIPVLSVKPWSSPSEFLGNTDNFTPSVGQPILPTIDPSPAPVSFLDR